MSTVISMDNTVSLCSMPTEVLVKILGSLPDVETVGSSSLTCHRIRDVCAANTKAITDALIASIECSKSAIEYYDVRLQFARRGANAYRLSPPPGFPFQPSPIQRAREIQAIAKIGHRAHNMYLTQMTQPTAIDRDFWQSIYYKALILSSIVLQRRQGVRIAEIQIKVFSDVDILVLSQISDMYAVLKRLPFRHTDESGSLVWQEYEGLPLQDWHQSGYLIFCIRSYLLNEHTWYRDWTDGIGEGNFMTRREPYGKVLKDLMDERHCAMYIKLHGYAQLLRDPCLY